MQNLLHKLCLAVDALTRHCTLTLHAGEFGR